MSNKFYHCDRSLGFLTITANRLLGGYFRKRLNEAGIDITAEQWGVLSQIWNNGSMPQEDLAGELCVDKSSLSRVLDGMERKGLVLRRRDPADARRNILRSTPAADALKEQCKRIADTTMEAVLRGIPDGDVAVCLAVLRQVKRNVRSLQE